MGRVRVYDSLDFATDGMMLDKVEKWREFVDGRRLYTRFGPVLFR